MSCIYFHSEHGNAELRGSERAYMGCVCNDLTLGVIGDLWRAREWLLPLFPKGHYIHNERDDGYFARTLEIALKVMDKPELTLPDGRQTDFFNIAINTVLLMGSDELKLLARLHGQCEVHCYVEGENREWLADIIRRGREKEIYRESEGWEEVEAFLRQRSDCPVVCSYSVCDNFPSYANLPDSHPVKQLDWNENSEEIEEILNNISTEEMWSLCMGALRSRAKHGLELTPKHWDGYFFRPNINAFNLQRHVA
jgi:hypothetical protein